MCEFGSMEDELQFGADHYLQLLLARKHLVARMLTAIKITAIAMALMLSLLALYKCTRLSGWSSTERWTVSKLTADQQADHTELQRQLQLISNLNASLDEMKRTKDSTDVVMFDCYRTSRLSRASVVTYDGCFIDTSDGAMDLSTGIFTVRVEGVYQLSFTAKYVSSSKGRFGAWSDIFVNETVVADSQREYNGNEVSTSESSTHTVLVLHPLHIFDRVKVQFNKDGASYIHSDHDHDVHFTANRIGDIRDGN